MTSDFDRHILGYSSLSPAGQDRLRRAAARRAEDMKRRATADFLCRLARGLGAALRAARYGKDSGRTSATSTPRP